MRILVLLLAATAAATLAHADRAAAQTPAPALEARAASLDTMLGLFEYLGDFANQAEGARQAAAFVRETADPKKGIEGIDPARPFGLYGFVTKNVGDSSAVLMVPVADESAVLGLLTGKAGLTPAKRDDGAYTVTVPNVPAPIYFRFANGYAYVTARDAKALAPKALIAPKAFFAATDGALASAQFHFDRVPADVRTMMLGQIELKVADAKKLARPDETPTQAKLREWAVAQLLAATKELLTSGKTLGVRLTVDPKSDELATEVTLSAVSGSRLSELFRGLTGRTAMAAGLATAKNPVASFGVHIGVAEGQQKEFVGHVNALLAEVKANAKGPERGVVSAALDAVAPTLRAGVLDFGVVATDASNAGGPSLVSANRLVKGAEVEKLVKLFAAFAPGDKVQVTYDVEKVDGVNLHKVVVDDPKLEEAFGTKTVWVGYGEDRHLVSIEPDGKAIRAAASAKDQPFGILAAEVSTARLVALTEKELSPEALKELTAEVFGGSDVTGRDAIRLTLDGGERLTLTLRAKGKALKFLATLDQKKKQ